MPEPKKNLAILIPPKEDYLMGVLMVTSAACRDPFGPSSALIVDSKDRPIAAGINMLLNSEYSATDKFSWDEVSRPYGIMTAVHAAIDRGLKAYQPSASSLDPFSGHTMYLVGPIITIDELHRCAANGLKDIIYGSLQPSDFSYERWEIVKKVAKIAGVKLNPFTGNLNWIRDKVDSWCEVG